MSNYGTNFAESEALLAAEEEDWMDLSRIIEEMLPSEREDLKLAARHVYNALLVFPDYYCG